MLASLIVVFREVLEAGLIVGIVLAATEGVAGRLRWISAGIAAGVAGAAVLAGFTGALSDAFSGTGQEIFTATILGLAVLMLGWHVTWMSRHARELAAEMRQAGTQVRQGTRSLAALATVVGVAVLREGAEVGLFLFGIAASGGQSAWAMAIGSMLGLVLAGAASFAIYRGLTAIPVHRLFSTTNALIMVLAAGMAGQAAAVLHSADLIPGWGDAVWNTSWLIQDGTMAGRTLHALVGYSARPCGVQLAAWVATVVTLAVLSRLVSGQTVARPRHAAAAGLALLLAAGLSTAARADDTPTLTFKDKHVYPEHLTVHAGEKIRITVINNDTDADEFESADLNREKLVAAGGKITVFLGPLDAGTYKFFRCFNRDTAQGVIEAK